MTNIPTPEYTAEQVAEVVEGLTAIITEPAECWHPTHISRDDIRTVLAEIKRLTLQVESAEADSKRLDWLQANATKELRIRAVYGKTYLTRWHRRYVTSHDRTGESLRECVDRFLDAARNQEGGNHG